MQLGTRCLGEASCKLGRTVQLPVRLREQVREISAVYVAGEARRAGHASALMRELCAEADRERMTLLLHVERDAEHIVKVGAGCRWVKKRQRPPIGPRSLRRVVHAERLGSKGRRAISAGATVAYAIECFENGLITKAQADGLELRWGNAEAIVRLTEKIGRREGFGEERVESIVHACQAAAPHLLASGNGSVINVSSVASLAGTPFMAHYGAAKAAVTA